MPDYLRPLTEPLTAQQLEAVNGALQRRGLPPHAGRPNLLSVFDAVLTAHPDDYADVARDVRAALERVEER